MICVVKTIIDDSFSFSVRKEHKRRQKNKRPNVNNGCNSKDYLRGKYEVNCDAIYKNPSYSNLLKLLFHKITTHIKCFSSIIADVLSRRIWQPTLEPHKKIFNIVYFWKHLFLRPRQSDKQYKHSLSKRRLNIETRSLSPLSFACLYFL